MADRVCSECGASLKDKTPTARTCSVRCRQIRARRRRKENAERGDDAQEQRKLVSDIVRRHAPDEARVLLRKELAPVVREAIDEDVIKAVGGMVSLTPLAVSVIEADLESDDPQLRSRAAALVMKYTVGHPALVKADDRMGEQMIVQFNLPRPDDVPQNDEIPQDAESVELRVCDICKQEKPANDFVADSDRCSECHERRRQEVLTKLGL